MNFATARKNMVENQIRTNRVTDSRLIDALDMVPRERFVPETLRGVAYFDGEVELGSGRKLMGVLVFARLLQAAEIKPSEIVLDVGCGTGYSASVLARLASTVVALESDAALAARAGALLSELGGDNVAMVSGPLAAGDAAHGPYDVIVLEGEVSHVPDALKKQLAPGGRLVAVIQAGESIGRATLIRNVAGTLSSLTLFDAKVATLPGFEKQPGFVF